MLLTPGTLISSVCKINTVFRWEGIWIYLWSPVTFDIQVTTIVAPLRLLLILVPEDEVVDTNVDVD